MKIAVIAWGSLVWDPRTLKTRGQFKSHGPTLPIEFCSVSRDGRLTLVIDEQLGTPCKTYHATSSYQDLGEAMENLRTREGGDPNHAPSCLTRHTTVGYVVTNGAQQWHSATAYQRHATAMQSVQTWCSTQGYQAAIWTMLESKFTARTAYSNFTTATAIEYLAQLPEDQFCTAAEYIRRAPQQIQTPVRAAFDQKWPRKKWYSFFSKLAF
jgi:hypothetical protein